MKFFITKIFISFILIQIIKMEKLKNDPIPWLIVDEYVYFIDTKPNYTSNETNANCLAEDMLFKILDATLPDLIEALHKTYGNNHTFWTYDNQIRKEIINKSLDGSQKCAKLTTSDGQFHAANCSARFGLICQKRIQGGILFYNNGTTATIDEEEVKEICDPHSKEYDKRVQLCLIEFFDSETFQQH